LIEVWTLIDFWLKFWLKGWSKLELDCPMSQEFTATPDTLNIEDFLVSPPSPKKSFSFFRRGLSRISRFLEVQKTKIGFKSKCKYEFNCNCLYNFNRTFIWRFQLSSNRRLVRLFFWRNMYSMWTQSCSMCWWNVVDGPGCCGALAVPRLLRQYLPQG
jgi:hypothetical protein